MMKNDVLDTFAVLLFVYLALTALPGCCPKDGLAETGTPAPGSATVLMAADALGCDFGCTTIAWADAETLPDGHYGLTTWDSCGCRIQVAYPTDEPGDLTAVCEILPHEAGHCCTRSRSEADAEAFANRIRRMIGCGSDETRAARARP